MKSGIKNKAPQLPGIIDGVPRVSKVAIAYKASSGCVNGIVESLESDKPLSQANLEHLREGAKNAYAKNMNVPKRDRACEKCLIGYLGYCPFASGLVGAEEDVPLTPAMASDLIGTNLGEDEVKGAIKERPPLDDFLDIAVADLFDGIQGLISQGAYTALRRDRRFRDEKLSDIRRELAAKHFKGWEGEILATVEQSSGEHELRLPFEDGKEDVGFEEVVAV